MAPVVPVAMACAAYRAYPRAPSLQRCALCLLDLPRCMSCVMCWESEHAEIDCFFAGLIFGFGLLLGGMANPPKC
jgi:hypothetical protein